MLDKKLIAEAAELRERYRQHFGGEFPNRIIGWWDPIHIDERPEELISGVHQMKIDVENAINSDSPIGEMSEEEWNNLMF